MSSVLVSEAPLAASRLCLHATLVRHPSATFFVRVQGHSMVGAGIHDGDLLLVDRALPPQVGQVVVAALDGALTVKWLRGNQHRYWLEAAHPDFDRLPCTPETHIWGVVVHAVHRV